MGQNHSISNPRLDPINNKEKSVYVQPKETRHLYPGHHISQIPTSPESEEPPCLQVDTKSTHVNSPENTTKTFQTFTRRMGTSGIGGQLYEVHLLALLLWEGIRRQHQFHLATNMEEAGDFDDLVYSYITKDDKVQRTVFLQAKHRENINKKIFVNTLLSEADKGDFNLKKYFTTFRVIQRHFSTSPPIHPILGNQFEDCEFIIFTNAKSGFKPDDNNLEKCLVKKESILWFCEDKYYYTLRKNGSAWKKMEECLKSASDCAKLAKELADMIISPEGINVDKGLVRDHHAAIAKDVVEVVAPGVGRLTTSSWTDSAFGSALLDELKTRPQLLGKDFHNIDIKLQPHFGKIKNLCKSFPCDHVTDKEIDQFLAKFKLFIDQPNAQELGDIIKRRIQMNLLLDENKITMRFNNLVKKIEDWWMHGEEYLTQNSNIIGDYIKGFIRYNVKKPISSFTGRREELNKLHSLLQISLDNTNLTKQILVCGLGGIGKSEFVKKYIQEYHTHFGHLLWIDAESEYTLKRSFLRLAEERLNISILGPDNREKSIESIIEETYRSLSDTKCLMVYDNAEGIVNIRKYLPNQVFEPDSVLPDIIATSRGRMEWNSEWLTIELNCFTNDESYQFVKKNLNLLPNLEDSQIKDLTDKLQCFPLALHQAVGYIYEQNQTRYYSIQNYIDDFDRNQKGFLNFIDNKDEYVRTTYTTWVMTMDKIKEAGTSGILAANILDLVAYVSSENIQRRLFRTMAQSEDELREAIRLLVGYSMMGGEVSQSSLCVHRLVQRVTRLEVRARGKDEEERILKEILVLLRGTLDKHSVAHAIAVWDHACQYNLLIKEHLQVIINIITYLLNAGKYQEGHSIGEKYIKRIECVCGPLNNGTLATKHEIARILQRQGNLDEALHIFKYVCEKRQYTLGPIHPDTLTTRHNIALVLQQQGDLPEALKMYKDIHSKQHDTLGSSHPDTLATRHNIAQVLQDQGDFPEALKMYEDVHKKENDTLGPIHPSTLTTRHNIAHVLQKQGNFEEALKVYQDVYNKELEVLGSTHPDTLLTQHNISGVLARQGHYTEALENFKEVYEKRKEVLGPDHPETLSTLNWIEGLSNKESDQKIEILSNEH